MSCPGVAQQPADQPVPPEGHQHGYAGHHRRQYDGQLHQPVNHSRQPVVAARKYVGDGSSPDNDHSDADEAGHHRQTQGGQRQVAGYRAPEVVLLRRSRQQRDNGQTDEYDVERARCPAQRSTRASGPAQRESS